ncbi:penicillin-binding protein 2 [Chamaesiphon sp. VAR_48_metabat_135_sub]|uniref:peptidoglycan D,D-transpeptidase FtsI family protein n=1 Tax=Chamaesiphon sp. VAR_48_metabat_135_sub TaxID=2964699 RepID=UPI00286D4DCB|nr:penicillin-binding protein 2 [Chamaesiphon sp. VAR_48_metabat_135_sub]
MSNIRRKKSKQFGNNHGDSVRRRSFVGALRHSISTDRAAPTGGTPSPRQQQTRHRPDPTNRIAGVWIVLGLGSFGLLLRLVWLQIVDAPNLQKKAQVQQVVSVRPFVPRRTILDRSNNQIAIDRPSYTIYAHPIQFSKIVKGEGLSKTLRKVKVTPSEMAQQLAPILGRDPQELLVKFQQRQTGVLIGSGLREDIKERIIALKLDGLDIRQGELDYTRFYPQDDMMAEVLGYLDYQRKPQAGVEYSQSLLLERKVPEYPLTKTAKGEILSDLVTPDFLHTDDLKLRLTVDLRLQRAARQALRQKMREWNAPRGTVIVMDAETGALRALVVEPTYNPNYYGRDVYNYGKIVGKNRATSLLQNWAVSSPCEPGSTFKPIAVAIALENGVIDPHTTIEDNGSVIAVPGTKPIKNSHHEKNGTIDIAQVLQKSSNVGMVKIMQRLKPSLYYDWLQRIGLGQKYGIDLPLERQGSITSRQEFLSSPLYPANNAFGQGFTLTPIQLVTLIGSLANGGKLVTPHVVEGLFDSAGVRKDKPTLPEPSQIFSPTNAKVVLEMMETVVTKGSGTKALIPGYRIAGKTGTAQQVYQGGYGRDDKKITSFAGILPVDKQHRYVVFAAIDEPKGKEQALGSNVAAPIVKSVMESLIFIDGIPPSNPAEIEKAKTDKKTTDKTDGG